ncbi:MAG TPA: immunoglobulin domain-containing protein [Verrucomicrobiota bacterium]|nr:immunoglobulin domain-containing protein [Verrucomicrobiota bacterium]
MKITYAAVTLLIAAFAPLSTMTSAQEYVVDGKTNCLSEELAAHSVAVSLPSPGEYTFTLSNSDFRVNSENPFPQRFIVALGGSGLGDIRTFTLNGVGDSKTVSYGGQVRMFFVDDILYDNSGSSTVEVSQNGQVLGTYVVDSKTNAIGNDLSLASVAPLLSNTRYTVTLKASDFRENAFNPSPQKHVVVLGGIGLGDYKAFTLNGIGDSKTTFFGGPIRMFFIDDYVSDNSGQSTVEITPAPDLVAWWAADGNANDSIGNLNGQIHGNVGFESGRVGQAFSFDGSSGSRVDIGDPEALMLTHSLTIEATIRMPYYPATGWGTVVFRGDDRNGKDAYRLYVMNDGRLYFDIASFDNNAVISAPVDLNRYIHVAATLDDVSGLMRLYLDGALASETSTAIRPLDRLDPGFGVAIGNTSGANSYYSSLMAFRGTIDDVFIYSRALSPDEIRRDSILIDLSNELTGWYDLNGDARDYSTTANHGISVGSVEYVSDSIRDITGQFNVNTLGYVSIPHVNEYVFTDEFTIQFWFKGGAANREHNKRILSKHWPTSHNYGDTWEIIFDAHETIPGGIAFYHGWAGSAGNSEALLPAIDWTEDKWNHVVFTFSNTDNALRGYVNGVLGMSASPTKRPLLPLNTTLPIEFMHDRYDGVDPGGINAAVGQLDDVAMWTRALAPREIAKMHMVVPVRQPPQIFLHPQNANLTNGQTAILSVSATGSEPMYYQWQKDHADLLGATNSCLIISNAHTSDSGLYSVSVRNSDGLQNSSQSTVSVECQPIPSVPLYVSASDGLFQDRVRLSWEAVSSATSYDIARSISTNRNDGTIVGSSSSNDYDDFVTDSSTYWYWVRASNDCGFSDWSSSDTGCASLPTEKKVIIDGFDTFSSTHHVEYPYTSSKDIFRTSVRRTMSWGSSYGYGYASMEADNVLYGGAFYLMEGISVSAVAHLRYTGLYDGRLGIPGSRLLGISLCGVYSDQASATINVVLWSFSQYGPVILASTAFNALPGGPYDLELYFGYLWTELPIDEISIEIVPMNAGCDLIIDAIALQMLTTEILPPTDISASKGKYTDFIDVSWDSVDGAQSYELFRSKTNSIETATLLAELLASATRYEDANIEPCVNYFYWLRTKGECCLSDYSDSVLGYPYLSIPERPTGISATKGIYSDHVEIIWFGITNATSYDIWRSHSSHTNEAVRLGTAYQTHFVDTNVVGGVTNWYWIVGQGVCGSGPWSLSDFGYSAAIILEGPKITVQPQSQTVNPGATATLGVTATGTPPLGYQWRMNGANIAGASNAALVLSNIQAANAGTYTVVVSNVVGSVQSTGAILTVRTGPTITVQPQSQTVNPGATATFSVTASGTTPLGYQWRKNGASIAGATNASLVLSNVQAANAGTYTVVVSNVVSSVQSTGAILTVRTGPTILVQPQSQTAIVGATVTFNVTADGTQPIRYQWRRNGSDLSGATNASMSIANVQMVNAGAYTVVVSNPGGSIESSGATLVVHTQVAIKVQPQSQVVHPGDTVTFSVEATGTGTLRYQWRKDGIDISGQNHLLFVLKDVQPANAGLYTVVVSNAVSSVESSGAILTVRAGPEITTQPASQTVVAGSNAVFTVAAAGTEPLGYQWSKESVPIAGATNSSLRIEPVRWEDAGTYRVVVTNEAGSVTSAAATLQVLVPVTITVAPANQVAALGGEAVFSVVAEGTQPLSYQWSKNGAAIAGATNATYRIGSVTEGDLGTYRVTVSNPAGQSVWAQATLELGLKAAIAKCPENQRVVEGSNAVFRVEATGTAPLRYQWMKESVPIGGATNDTYSIVSVVWEHYGTYQVAVANQFGTNRCDGIKLYVLFKPEITIQPASQTVVAGSNAVFTVAAAGTEPLGYQWSKDSLPIGGATNSSLRIEPVRWEDAGTYRVVVTNEAGSVTSAAATLQVLVPVTITVAPANQVAALGGEAVFSVVAEGTQPLSYQWSKNGAAIAGATNATYRIGSVTEGDLGTYRVTVSNPAGQSVWAQATLELGLKAAIAKCPENQRVVEGSNAVFRVEATGTAPLRYQWMKESVPIGGATNDTYSIVSVVWEHYGTYQVAVANQFGTNRCDGIKLYVLFKPEITIQPASQTVVAGSNAVFTVAAAGTEPLGYQWSKDSLPIGGATNSSLRIEPVRWEDAGTYRVVVTNEIGSVTSKLATLIVKDSEVGAIGDLPACYTNGQPFYVEIRVTPPVDTKVYAVHDLLPAGWSASHISANGIFKSGKVQWVFADGLPRLLNYMVTPSAGRDEVAFAGIVSFDGVNDMPIRGNRRTAVCIDERAPYLAVRIMTLIDERYIMLTITGEPGLTYLIQTASSVDTEAQWETVDALTLDGVESDWFDLDPIDSEPRFYRAVLLEQ